jgi:hypothetical protein
MQPKEPGIFKAPKSLLLITLAILGSISPFFIQNASAMSNEMKSIVDQLKKDDTSLDVSNIKKSSEKEFSAKTSKLKLEEFKFHNKRYIDTFSYVIYFDRANRVYWVRRMGGFAGVEETYGPKQVPKNSLRQ